jgi:pimeloyl-ACP methyl ester carboxylesterase
MTTPERTESQHGHYIQANGLNIYYEEHGQGKPLLLIHGGTVTAESWQPYLAAFAEHYRVITPDSRGHGRTSNPTGIMSYRLLADDMAAFVQALGLHKPLIFGYSDGGQVALEIGMRYPDLPQALIVGATWFKFNETYSAWVQNLFGDRQSPDLDTEKFERENPDWTGWLRQVYGPDNWKTALKQLKPMWTTPLNYTSNDFVQVVAPTLVLVGDRDDFIPVEEASEMYRLLPNAELAVLPGADHLAAFTKAPLAQALVLDFLSRHSDSVGSAALSQSASE